MTTVELRTYAKMMRRLSPEEPLSGLRVRLRAPMVEELSFIQTLWNDPETMALVGGPCSMTDEQMRAWYARMVTPGEGTDLYLLIFSEEDEPIGEVSFHRLDRETMQADFNIKVLASQRGKGYGSEAIALMLEYFFVDLGGETMIDDLALDNLVGRRTMEGFGFIHDPAGQVAYRVVMTKAMYRNRAG